MTFRTHAAIASVTLSLCAVVEAGNYSGGGGPIPDGSRNPGLLLSTIEVTDAGTVSTITVVLNDLAHTWAGDLAVKLTHLQSGASQTLFVRPGYPDVQPPWGDNSNFGGTYLFADSFDGNLWAVAAQGNTSYVIPGGNFFASGPNTGAEVSLNATFAGMPISGTWELSVGDHQSADTGSLGGWQIAFEAGPATDCGAPGAGDCSTPHDTPSCNDKACCATVCAEDALCCVTQWDVACADLAVDLCGSGPQFLGPTLYASKANSPWDLSQLGVTRVLEDFEDGILHLPGLSFSAGAVKNPSPTTDSVDADDGTINGVGTGGRSWSVPANTILTVNFSDEILGGFPTEVGFVLTSSDLNGSVSVTAFGPTGLFAGFKTYTFSAGGVDGSTADDKFLGIDAPAGISGFSVSAVLGEMEVDHVQFNLPVPSTATILGPSPYVSAANSPLNVAGLGYSFALEDFEDNAFNTPGVSHTFSFIVPPLPITDSVDGDDTVLDGNGSAGRSIYTGPQPITMIAFDGGTLGGLPTSFGIVATDCVTAGQKITLSIYGGSGEFLGLREFAPMFDALNDGATAEDRFIGCTVPAGIGRIELSPGFTEYDHVQYNVPGSLPDPFLGPLPYLELADSPWSDSEPLAHFFDTIEDGVFDDLPNASANFTQVVLPSIFTDSVDGDDGLLDNNGNGGHSLLQLLPGPMQVTLSPVGGAQPTNFGFVWTDGGTGISNVTMQVFDAADVLVATKTFMALGDNTSQGSAAEDRFLGVAHASGIGKVLISSNRAFECDHLQMLVPSGKGTPGDLNGDGLVDGLDLGILLSNWGGAGAGDLDGNGMVDGADFGLLLGFWP